MNLTFSVTTPEEALYVAQNLRPFDIEECRKEAPRLTPEEAAYGSYRVSSLCLSVRTDGETAGLLGLGAMPLSDDAQIFCFGTPGLDRIPPREWVQTGKEIVNAFLNRYPRLHNRTLETNTKVIRWLKCIGFTLHPSQNGWVQFEIFKQEK